MHNHIVGFSGALRVELQCEHPDRVHVQTSRDGRWKFDKKRDLFVIEEPNGIVNNGLQIALDRWFGINGPPVAIGYIGVDNDASAVTSGTTYLHGAAGATVANQVIKAISPTASRAAQTVTAGATFTNSDFTSGVFIINKIGLLTTATDAGTGLIDVIGGASGSDPFSRTFVLDLRNAGTISVGAQIAMTAVNVKANFPSPL